MKPMIRQGDTLLEFGGRVLEGHYACHCKPMACHSSLYTSPPQH